MLSSEQSQQNVMVVTLGCAKNQVDSEVILGVLSEHGFRPVADPEQADLILVNTCAFLESAVEEGVDCILELVPYRVEGRCKKLVVAGCMVERYRDRLSESLPEVDLFVSTDELTQVGVLSRTSRECVDLLRKPTYLYDELTPRLRDSESPSAYVKIAEGCDKPCAFCIIPRLRGSYRSRSSASVVREVRNLVLDGVREINLVAQDLTAYACDRKEKGALEVLLRELDVLDVGGLEFWIRCLYAYPLGITDSFISILSDSARVCPYLDLPLQHISDTVLRRMNRPLGEDKTRALIEKIRREAPELALRTTFLVGFPGETEEDVKNLESFVAEGHFTHVGVFPYSQEQEARSFSFPEQIPPEISEERMERILLCQQELVLARHQSLIGSTQRVLIEGLHPESDLLISSRAQWQAPETDGVVIINEVDEELGLGEESEILARIQGKFGLVEIQEEAGYDLVGRLVGVEDVING